MSAFHNFLETSQEYRRPCSNPFQLWYSKILSLWRRNDHRMILWLFHLCCLNLLGVNKHSLGIWILPSLQSHMTVESRYYWQLSQWESSSYSKPCQPSFHWAESDHLPLRAHLSPVVLRVFLTLLFSCDNVLQLSKTWS